MSFILDALRKSEHERQRSTLPGLSQVPLATPPAQLPRWALVVIGVLAAGVLVLGGAWWQSTRAPTETTAAAPMIERSVELPPPAAAFTPPRLTPPAPSQSAPARPSVEDDVAAAEPDRARDRRWNEPGGRRVVVRGHGESTRAAEPGRARRGRHRNTDAAPRVARLQRATARPLRVHQWPQVRRGRPVSRGPAAACRSSRRAPCSPNTAKGSCSHRSDPRVAPNRRRRPTAQSTSRHHCAGR